MRVHYRSKWARAFLPKRFVAITLASHVLTRERRLDARILRHERIHVEQWKRYGRVGFLVRYLWNHLRWGYERNPLEIEAREAEAVTSPRNEIELQAAHRSRESGRRG